MRPSMNQRRLLVIAFDAVVVVVAYVLAFLLRFDLRLNWDNLAIIRATFPCLAPYLVSFWAFSMYQGIYYFSSFEDLLNITQGVLAGALVSGAAILFFRQGQFPRSVLFIHPIITFLGVGWIRFGIRLIKSRLNMPRIYSGGYRDVLIIGAGELAEGLVRQMRRTKEPRYRVVGFIDDDRDKWGRRIHGSPVFGGHKSIAEVFERHHVDEIVITIATRRAEVVRAVMESLRDCEQKPQVKIAPALDEMLRAPNIDAGSLRKVRPADLLNRDVVRLDMTRIAHFIQGKTVLVTGAGGTIGSELCRQVLQYGPGRLVLIESHATSLFYSASELTARAPQGVEIVPVLGDIRDQALIDHVFKWYKPQVVLHAAAHKHVHQLEFNVPEGISNNVLGTYYLACAARKYEAEALLLVSTDKAVKPSSVMGATKRAAELILKSFSALGGKTRFVSVRFGNVLGSSGSVLEIFQRQIAAGGPITVTHPDVTRYFMTVEEAVQLILQAATMARGGEIFVLKMGTPVRILDMARNLLLLSGLEPGKDIRIQFTGLKQGEKLEEELMEDPAHCDDSEHPSIMILRPGADPATQIEKKIVDLEILSRTAGSRTLIAKLRELVPTFVPDAHHEDPQGRTEPAAANPN